MENLPTLYTKTGCPWCAQAREVLAERSIRYHEVSVSEDDAAFAEMERISGQRFAPVLQLDGHVLADFGADELRPFLDQHTTGHVCAI